MQERRDGEAGKEEKTHSVMGMMGCPRLVPPATGSWCLPSNTAHNVLIPRGTFTQAKGRWGQRGGHEAGSRGVVGAGLHEQDAGPQQSRNCVPRLFEIKAGKGNRTWEVYFSNLFMYFSPSLFEHDIFVVRNTF